tara:strand:- start:238 stop:447 length:210 start_codon:yes stop_codon:yes gene_type:complete
MLRILSLMLVLTTVTADFRNLATEDKKASKVGSPKASASAPKAKTDNSPIVPMSDYSKDIRALTCWECF